MTTATFTSNSLEALNDAKRGMTESGVLHHAFLIRFERSELSRHQLQRFAVQWYLTARLHKVAFPVLVWNTPDDDTRFELIEILREEYGNGDRDMIHARLLRRFVDAVGVSEGELQAAVPSAPVSSFGRRVQEVWKNAAPPMAFGLHFALEFLAAALHVHFANGLAKYSFLTDHDREYFEYHRIAEEQHADHSEAGFIRYADDPRNHPMLRDGVALGVNLLESLWNGFDGVVFGTELDFAIGN